MSDAKNNDTGWFAKLGTKDAKSIGQASMLTSLLSSASQYLGLRQQQKMRDLQQQITESENRMQFNEEQRAFAKQKEDLLAKQAEENRALKKESQKIIAQQAVMNAEMNRGGVSALESQAETVSAAEQAKNIMLRNHLTETADLATMKYGMIVGAGRRDLQTSLNEIFSKRSSFQDAMAAATGAFEGSLDAYQLFMKLNKGTGG
tara:strand:+ start:4148 stop:4759 length:612 start_codon:yes stop_codon:yes gene_type:complete